ncbi:MAG: hypothetical protein MZV64_28440 [Ignavibacteriales bacterium]|nr:hypothetical protein [Ignavibacteriales bacterium]
MTLHPGADLRVVTLDSSAVEGNLVGIRLAPGNPYRERFRDFRDRTDSPRHTGLRNAGEHRCHLRGTRKAPHDPWQLPGSLEGLPLAAGPDGNVTRPPSSYGVGLDEIQSITGDSGDFSRRNGPAEVRRAARPAHSLRACDDDR